MFRFIAVALVSTFALLGLVGAGMEGSPGQRFQPRSTQMGLTDLRSAERPPAMQPGARYVVAAELPVHVQPYPDAPVTTLLVPGMPVVLVEPAPDGFAYVQAEGGLSGYVRAAALAQPPG